MQAVSDFLFLLRTWLADARCIVVELPLVDTCYLLQSGKGQNPFVICQKGNDVKFVDYFILSIENCRIFLLILWRSATYMKSCSPSGVISRRTLVCIDGDYRYKYSENLLIIYCFEYYFNDF